MKRFLLVLSREMAHQWHSMTGFVAGLFFAFLLIFIAGYAYNHIQTMPDFVDITVLFSLIFLVSTQFSVSFLGMRSKSFIYELKIFPISGANIFLCRTIAIFAGVSAINLISVPVFVVFFNLSVSFFSTFLLFTILLAVSVAQISLGLITQFSYVSGSRHISNYALILTLPLLIPVFTAQLYVVKSILLNESARLNEIMVIIGLDLLYFVAGLIVFELSSKN